MPKMMASLLVSDILWLSCQPWRAKQNRWWLWWVKSAANTQSGTSRVCFCVSMFQLSERPSFSLWIVKWLYIAILYNQAGLSVDSWFLAPVYSWLTVTSPPAPPRTGTAAPSSQLFNFFRFLYWSSFIINCCGYRHCILFSISNDSSHRNILNVK